MQTVRSASNESHNLKQRISANNVIAGNIRADKHTHDSVKRTMATLKESGIIAFSQTVEKGDGRPLELYHVNKRDSLVVVARVSPEFTARVIDRWQELEQQQTMPAIPQTYAEALQLAADQARQLEEQAPKVAFVENLVERGTLMTATQIAQKHGISAIKLNKLLDEIGGIYSKSVKRARTFTQAWIDKGYGELKQTQEGHSQPLFTPSGEVRINEMLISEGVL